jgi:hypothetical protein
MKNKNYSEYWMEKNKLENKRACVLIVMPCCCCVLFSSLFNIDRIILTGKENNKFIEYRVLYVCGRGGDDDMLTCNYLAYTFICVCKLGN